MNLHDPCPNCGHRRQRTLMSTDPNAPSVIGLWKGEGEAQMQLIAKIGTVIIAALIIAGILQAFNIQIY